MVTNLTAEARAKWAEATSTKDPVKKLRLLQEFYSIMPHHKGTEKLEAMVKRQMAILRQEIEELKTKKKGAVRFDLWAIKKGDFPQVALLSTLETSFNVFKELTALTPKLYQIYKGPVVGPFKVNDLLFEIYLTPYAPNVLGRNLQEKLLRIIRNVDVILIIDKEGIVNSFKEFAESYNIEISSEGPKVSFRRMSSGGIRFIGSSKEFSCVEAEKMLKEFKIQNAVVEIRKGATLDDLEAVIFGREFKRVFVIKEPSSFTENWKRWLSKRLLEKLELIKVYTKSPNGPVGERPLLVRKGITVIEVARLIHKDLVRYFKYAKVYRNRKGVRVGKDFELKDGDLIEIYA